MFYVFFSNLDKNMKPKTRSVFFSPENKSSNVINGGHGGLGGGSSQNNNSYSNAEVLELRPGGLMVQMRSSDSNINQKTMSISSTITVRVKFGSSYHNVSISPHASFGELKKLLAGPSGLHPQDQKLIFKNKERDSRTYLDFVRVKDGSKIVLVEDVLSRERRLLELHKTSNFAKASKSLADLNLEVEKLAQQVKSVEGKAACRSGKLIEKEVENLTEMLMSKLIQLDAICAEGDLKLQRRTEVMKVQKNIEILDKLKLNNSLRRSHVEKVPFQKQQEISQKEQQLSVQSDCVVSTKWETFD